MTEHDEPRAEPFAQQDAFIADMVASVRTRAAPFMAQQPSTRLLSLTTAEWVIRAVVPALIAALFEAWKQEIIVRCKRLGQHCPKCGRRRKCKERAAMKVDVLGLSLLLPRLYLECGFCAGSGVSIVRLLVGVSSGSKSLFCKLSAAYCGAKESYRKASDSLRVHYGQWIERTTVRKMAIEIERQADAYVQRQRAAALETAGLETARRGHPVLDMTADGGKVRSGQLVACRPGDAGFGQRSPKRKAPKKTWEVTWKEIITFDVRIPGALDPEALDVLVPVLAQQGERARRMLAIAIRAGLGDNTEVLGLGDMGSQLAQEFDEAFIGYTSSWCADWTHTCGYIKKAATVLSRLDPADWKAALRQAVWDHDRHRVDLLLAQAQAHHGPSLLPPAEKCPLAALRTYVTNNWRYFRFAERCQRGLAYVSARAEAQVRDRTKDRFAGPGVWKLENLEPKAALRALIAEGRWDDFVIDQIRADQAASSANLHERLTQAVTSGALTPAAVRTVLGIDLGNDNASDTALSALAA